MLKSNFRQGGRTGPNDHFTRPKGSKFTGVLTDYDRKLVTTYLRYFNWTEVGIRLGETGERHVIRQRIYKYVRERPHIRVEIDRRLKDRAARADLSEARILEEYRRIAMSNPLAQCRVFDEDGNAKFDIGLLTEADMAAISSIKLRKDGSVDIKFHDKMDALEKMGKRLKLFPTNSEDGKRPTTVRFIVEGSPRNPGDSAAPRIAAEVRIDHGSEQSQGTGVVEHARIEGRSG